MSREHALAVWQAAVDAVKPAPLVRGAVEADDAIRNAPRVIVVGAGKAGPGMAAGLEAALADRLDRVEGVVNVPAGMTAPLQRVRLHAARPQGVNEPTADGVAGAEEMLRLLNSAGAGRCRGVLAVRRRVGASARARRRRVRSRTSSRLRNSSTAAARPSTR